MGKTRDLIKKIRDTKGILHAKMGTIRDGSSMDITEAEDRYEREVARIHRKTIQKNIHDPVNHDGVITHMEPDTLECEVKWALKKHQYKQS